MVKESSRDEGEGVGGQGGTGEGRSWQVTAPEDRLRATEEAADMQKENSSPLTLQDLSQGPGRRKEPAGCASGSVAGGGMADEEGHVVDMSASAQECLSIPAKVPSYSLHSDSDGDDFVLAKSVDPACPSVANRISATNVRRLFSA